MPPGFGFVGFYMFQQEGFLHAVLFIQCLECSIQAIISRFYFGEFDWNFNTCEVSVRVLFGVSTDFPGLKFHAFSQYLHKYNMIVT